MDISSIVIAVVAFIAGILGFKAFKDSRNKREHVNQSEYETEIQEDIDVEELPQDDTKKGESPSSKKYMEKAMKKIMEILGVVLIAVGTLPMDGKEITPEEEQYILNFFNHMNQYVEMSEEEMENLRYNNRKDTEYIVKPTEDGKKIDLKVIIPTQQVVLTDDGPVKKPGEPIVRNILINPKVAVTKIPPKSGIELFTGFMLGFSYDILEDDVDKRVQPMVGFELVSWHSNPITIANFIYIDPKSFGTGIGIGPLKGPNLKMFMAIGKKFEEEVVFKAGVSAVVQW